MTSLQEYAFRNGLSNDPPGAVPEIVTYQQMQDRHELACHLKQSIIQQLEQGNNPESILHTAIRALSLATNDPDFFEVGNSFLNGDKEEQSLFLDLEEMQAKRNERRKAYFDKRRREINRQVSQLDADRRELLKELEGIPKESV